MAKRLIELDHALRVATPECLYEMPEHDAAILLTVRKKLQGLPTVDAVELPCKIGDYVWAIRNFKGHKHPQRGVVSDMYFTRDMELSIVVKYVARGKWGETVFATDAEAYAVINGEWKEA